MSSRDQPVDDLEGGEHTPRVAGELAAHAHQGDAGGAHLAGLQPPQQLGPSDGQEPALEVAYLTDPVFTAGYGDAGVSDLAAKVAGLRTARASFRNEIVTGVGGRHDLLEDPSGNPVELFGPTLPEASLSGRGRSS